MTVFNRSNDAILGALGANVVHMSFLQEYVAACLGIRVGKYHQISANFHLYKNSCYFEEWLKSENKVDYYHGGTNLTHIKIPTEKCGYELLPSLSDNLYIVPLLDSGNREQFDREVKDFIDNPEGVYKEPFLTLVASPMCLAFRHHKERNYPLALEAMQYVRADDWRIAGVQWLTKRQTNWKRNSGRKFVAKPPVNSKIDFVARYQRGEFGNASPTWQTLEELLATSYRGLVHFRNRVAGGPTWYNIPRDRVWFEFCELCALPDSPVFNMPDLGPGYTNLYYSGMAPSEKTMFQGEVVRDVGGLFLYYNCQPLPMRDGFSIERRYAHGTQAKLLLDHYFNPNSREWLDYLLGEYPDHVVEFSAYSVEWGTVPGHNVVFWEVRNY